MATLLELVAIFGKRVSLQLREKGVAEEYTSGSAIGAHAVEQFIRGGHQKRKNNDFSVSSTIRSDADPHSE